jgi:hypothetical protein
MEIDIHVYPLDSHPPVIFIFFTGVVNWFALNQGERANV